MKKIKNTLKILVVLLFVSTAYSVSAQGPPPPPAGGDNTSGAGGNNLGGNAPIGGGLFILLGLGAAYGGRKIYNLHKEGLEE